MADNTTNESITELMPKALANWIEEYADMVKETNIGFPEPNETLRMPAVTVAAQTPIFNPTAVPYPINPVDPGNIANSQAQVEWVVGDYEVSLQVDLWCGSKEELDDAFDELFNVLNPQISPMGLRIPMEEYYNLICSYLYVGHERINDEGAATRDEWRIKLDVLATCKAVRSRKEFIIETTDIQAEINKDVLVVEGD